MSEDRGGSGVALRGGWLRARLALLPALSAYLGLRLLVLGTGFDASCHPAFELTLSGNLGHLWLEALGRGAAGPPLWLGYDNAGGQLFGGLVALPLFALLGDSYLTLKLVPILMGAGVLVLVQLLLAERAGPRAAQVGAFVFALGPPTTVQLSTMALGSHLEALLPMSACYLLWWRWLDAPRSRSRAFAFGLAAGFAVFLYFGALLLLALFAAGHLLGRGPRALARELRAAAPGLAPGLALGLAPLIVVQLASARPAGFLAHNFASLGQLDLARAGTRAVRFLLEIAPRAAACEQLGPLPAVLGDGLWALGGGLLLCCGLGLVVRGLRGHHEALARTRALALLPLCGWLPAVLLVHAFSRLEFQPAAPPLLAMKYRYLAAHFWCVALLAGFVAAQLERAPAALRLAGASGLCALALAVPFSWSLVGRDETGLREGRAYPGWHLPLFGRVLLAQAAPQGGTGPWSSESVSAWLGSLAPAEQDELAFGYAHALGYHRRASALSGDEGGAASSTELRGPWPREERGALARGFGSALGKRVREGGLAPESVQAWLAAQDGDDRETARNAAEGLPLDIAYPFNSRAQRRLRGLELLPRAVPPELEEHLALGLGLAGGRARAGALEEETLRGLARGLASGLGEAAFERGLALGRRQARRGCPEGSGTIAGVGTDLPPESEAR